MNQKQYSAIAILSLVVFCCMAAVPLRSLSPNSPVPTASDIVAAQANATDPTARASAAAALTHGTNAESIATIATTNAVATSRITGTLPVIQIATNAIGAITITFNDESWTNVLYFNAQGMLTNATHNP